MWKKDLFGRRGTEICENLVTMGPTVHAYWRAAFFALKPLELSEDKKSLKLQFFWLRPLPRTGGVCSTGVLAGSQTGFEIV